MTIAVSRQGTSALDVQELPATELGDWDARTVHAAEGHVLQSLAWSEHRRTRGWRRRFLAVGEARVLVLERPWPVLGGGSAYIPRGPVSPAAAASDDRARLLLGVSDHLASAGIDVVASDAEIPAADAAYRARITAAGFQPIEEIQPSRHRMSLPLGEGVDEAAILSGVSKQTRQRIRRAEKDGLVTVRYDRGSGPAGDRPEAFVTGRDEESEPALTRFYGLLRDTGERRGFGFAGPDEFVGWWCRALAAGHLVLLEARDGSPGGEVLGGLLLYRHGARLSTAHSGDVATRRRDRPGTMHLLRWRAIQLALAEGRDEMDLGGVDVPGARRPPAAGEPMHGLYEHKRSFGAEWLELTGAHERVFRSWRYRTGRVASAVARRLPR